MANTPNTPRELLHYATPRKLDPRMRVNVSERRLLKAAGLFLSAGLLAFASLSARPLRGAASPVLVLLGAGLVGLGLAFLLVWAASRLDRLGR